MRIYFMAVLQETRRISVVLRAQIFKKAPKRLAQGMQHIANFWFFSRDATVRLLHIEDCKYYHQLFDD
jgi:hypothetical protein